MSRRVIVTNISEKASEKTVKDFFLFCGKIKEFELIKEECSDKQIAYIEFERDTAAKTALMLTNAVIGDCQITVRSADDTTSGGDDLLDDPTDGQLIKPKAAICAEILAAGYTLQDTILEKGIEFDKKIGVSKIFNEYLAQIQANLKDFDQKYQFTARATNIEQKYSVLDNAKHVIDQAHGTVNNLLETPVGKMICDYLYNSQKQVSDVQTLARKIADEKKHDRTYPNPSHSHSNDQVSESVSNE